MKRVDTVVIGAGQAGLPTSCCLTQAELEHFMLEKERTRKTLRDERWDSSTFGKWEPTSAFLVN